jgi:hypothetical protein
MPSYFDSLAKARAARLEREARDDSPLPIHVDPKSGLGSGLDIIHPPPVPFGGRKHGASDDFLPRAPIASVVDPADLPPGWRVDKGVQASPACHTRFYFGDAEQHRAETPRVPFVRAHFDVVAESEDLDFEGEHKGPNWEKYDTYAAIAYDEIVVPPGAGRVRGFFDRGDDDTKGYDSDEEREARLAGVGGDATRDTRAISSAEYLAEALRLKGIDVSEDDASKNNPGGEDEDASGPDLKKNTGGFAWTSLGGAPAGSGAFRFDETSPKPHALIHPQLREWYVRIASMRPRSRDDRALLSKLQGAAIAHVLREFESPEFNDVMSREFDRRHEVLTERLVARDEEAAKLTTECNETRATLARVEEEKRTVEERLKHTEDALATANATVAALKESAARLAAEAAEAAERSD